MIDILSANPISNVLVYAKEIKKDSLTRQIQQLSCKLQHQFDIKIIDKISELKVQLETLNLTKKLRNINEIGDFFDKFDIDFEKINNIKIGYLIDNFLVKNEITMISALPSTGKSLISAAASNMLLVEGKIDFVFYIDGDNSIATIKERNIHHLKNIFSTKFKYFVGLNRNELFIIVDKLQKLNLENTLVIFDSIKNFIIGDRDKNKDVSSGMEVLKQLRNNGASVIFLHHINKNLETEYAGSSAFLEDTSNAFILRKNLDKNTFILKPFKARTGNLHELAFKYLDNHTLLKLDLDFFEEQEIKNVFSSLFSASSVPNIFYIFGSGGVTSWFLPQLLKSLYAYNIKLQKNGCSFPIDFTIFLIDGDKVETKNLLRQNFILSDVGQNKALVLSERYSHIYPNIEIKAIDKYFYHKPFIEKYLPDTLKNYDNNFVFTAFENFSPVIKALSAQQAVPIVNKTTFSDVDLFVPQLEEQKRIGDYFITIDYLITLHQRELEETKKKKKSFPR
mgnify:CR=1 FL=1